MKRLSEWGTFNGRSTRAFKTLKTMALAPMASASVSIAVTAKPGDLRNWRSASRRSAIMLPPSHYEECEPLPLPERAAGDRYTLVRTSWFHLMFIVHNAGTGPPGPGAVGRQAKHSERNQFRRLVQR